jgi:hypothetical protein
METEDSRPTESNAMILVLTPDEGLVVDVTRGLNSGAVVEPAYGDFGYIVYWNLHAV